MTLQGREITKDNIELVQRLIEANPSQNRTWLSKELCLLWDWRAANGQIKDMACRPLLSKLELQGLSPCPGVALPVVSGAVARSLSPMFYIILLLLPVLFSVLKPVHVQLVEGTGLLGLFQRLLSRYHYLSFQQHCWREPEVPGF